MRCSAIDKILEIRLSESSLMIAALFFLACFAETTSALEIEVSCPASVASGSPLRVDVNITNDVFDPVVYVRSVGTAVIGNPGNGTSLPVIYGPWNTPVNMSFAPGFSSTVPVTITDQVDATLDGKIAIATIMLLDDDGKIIEGGSCAVAVQP